MCVTNPNSGIRRVVVRRVDTRAEGPKTTIPGIVRAGVTFLAAALVTSCAVTQEERSPAPHVLDRPAAVTSPESVVANASAATFAAGTARFTSSSVVSGADAEGLFMHGSMDFSRQLTEGEMITPWGAVRFVSNATTSYSQPPYGENRWLAVDNAAQGGLTPTQQFSLLTHTVTDLRELERTQVRGVPTRHLTMRVDPLTVPAFSGTPVATLVNGPQPLDLFVDDHGRANRMRITIALAGGDTITIITEYFDFGIPVSVQMPDPGLVIQSPPN